MENIEDTGTAPHSGNGHGHSVVETARDRFRAEGRHIAETAKDRALHAAEQRKSEAVDVAHDISAAINKGSDELRERGRPQVARYVALAADEIEQFSSRLEGRGISDLMGEVEGFARRRPGLLFGAALLLGFGAVRFAMASQRQYQGGYDRSDGSPDAGAGRSSYDSSMGRTAEKGQQAEWSGAAVSPGLEGERNAGRMQHGIGGTPAQETDYNPEAGSGPGAKSQPTGAPQAPSHVRDEADNPQRRYVQSVGSPRQPDNPESRSETKGLHRSEPSQSPPHKDNQ